jgi:tetratricopeptide (TPR) repeat protein
MTTDSNNHISGSGNQQFQDCSIGRDLHINVFKNDQDENVESYDKLSQFDRLKKAIDMTRRGQESFSTNKKKALDLFYKAQRCYPKLPEAYELAGLIEQDYKEYLRAIDLFNEAKTYYQDVESIYCDINKDDLAKEGFELELKDRIESIYENVDRVDTNIKKVEALKKRG